MTGISLQDLARLSRELNEASDALSDQIAEVESALNELKLGDSSEQFPDRDSEIPLREASRDDRIAAVEKLPNLIRKLEGEAKRMIVEARSKASKVGEFAGALRKA